MQRKSKLELFENKALNYINERYEITKSDEFIPYFTKDF